MGDSVSAEAGNAPTVSFAEAVRVWARIGLTGFGGPAGQIALMHRVLVEEKRWIGEARFLHALNFCMLLPGPEAQQLATYIGWLLHGVRGGLAAGLLFILPGFVVLLALSLLYVLFGGVPIVQGLLFGLKAAVLAIVAEALLRIGRRALKTWPMAGVAVAAFAAIAFLDAPFPLIVAIAALTGFIMPGLAPTEAIQLGAESHASARPSRGGWTAALRDVAIWGAIWLAPVALLAGALGQAHILTELAMFFSKAAMVTFGGAYAVLAYVGQQAVETHHWLRPDEMLTGIGLAETTPGPLILVLVFVGFLAGYRGSTGFEPMTGGILGALVTLWVTFAPSFLFIFAGAPFVERLRGNRALARALAAVTAAVVGVIANLALWFGLHVLFAEVGEVAWGPLTLPAPDPASFDPAAALIALAAAVALLKLYANLLAVLAGAALAGMGLRLTG